MRKLVQKILPALALTAALVASPIVRADSLEDSFQECSYPKMADMVILRPLGATGLVFGTVLTGIMLVNPATTIPTIANFGYISHKFIGAPFTWTVTRELGECRGVDRTY